MEKRYQADLNEDDLADLTKRMKMAIADAHLASRGTYSIDGVPKPNVEAEERRDLLSDAMRLLWMYHQEKRDKESAETKVGRVRAAMKTLEFSFDDPTEIAINHALNQDEYWYKDAYPERYVTPKDSTDEVPQ